jgi:hypothetical protein
MQVRLIQSDDFRDDFTREVALFANSSAPYTSFSLLSSGTFQAGPSKFPQSRGDRRTVDSFRSRPKDPLRSKITDGAVGG